MLIPDKHTEDAGSVRGSGSETFFWKALAAVSLTASLVAAGLAWSVCRDIPPLAAMARYENEPKLSLGAAEREKFNKITLLQIIDGMNLLNGNPEIMLSADQSRQIAAALPLVNQIIDDGMAGENTVLEGSSDNYLDNVPFMVKNNLWSVLNDRQRQEIVGLLEAGRLNSSAQEILGILPDFYKRICLDVGLTDEFSENGLSPMRKRLDKLRVIHWIIGIILLGNEGRYAVTPDQARVLKPMIAPLMLEVNKAPGVRPSTYFPILESQVCSVLTDEQQTYILQLLWNNAIFDKIFSPVFVFNQFDSFLNSLVYGSYYEVPTVEKLLQGEDTDEDDIVTVLFPVAIIDTSLYQMLCGIMFVLENDDELRFTDEQVNDLLLIRDEIEECFREDHGRDRNLYIRKVEAKVLSYLNDAQVQKIKDVLSVTYVPEKLARNEFEKFLAARMDRRRYVYDGENEEVLKLCRHGKEKE